MKLHELSPAAGSTKEAYRKGRGAGSGNGKTGGRGHKGQKARSGGGVRIGFEGGQMPLARLVPKYGFKNFNRVSYRPVNVMSLQDFADNGIFEINPEILIQYGFAGRKELIKILGDGELTAKMTVKAHAWSKSAEEAITKVGGTIEKI